MDASNPSQIQTNNGNEYSKVVMEMRRTFESGITQDLQFRRRQLTNLRTLLDEGQSQILEAEFKDLHKNLFWSLVSDFTPVTVEIDSQLKHLEEYAGKERLPFNLITPMDDGYVRREPLGVVLILATWNLPFQTAFQPLVGAIAAGNCVILKPSELSPLCAQVMAKLLPKYLDPSCYKIIEGDAEVSKSLLKNKFDHIFFTGSQSVGKFILQAAAPFLTPVTLELGGLNPCYIHETANCKQAAKKILWGKLAVGGQLCVSPGYVMCSAQIQDEVVKYMKIFLKEFFGENARESPDICRIVNTHHFNRLKKLLETTQGKTVIGGNTDESDLWIEPTFVANVCPNEDALMQEEIYGPILPFVVVSSLDEAIGIIRSKTKPLASYIFSNNDAVTEKYIRSFSCGSTGINDVIWQAIRPGLPFGGVGDSGMGNYHGKATFDTFSHKRAVLKVSQDYLTERVYDLRYSPHTNFKVYALKWIAEHFEMLNVPVGLIFSHSLAGLCAALFLYIFMFVYTY